MGFESVTKIIAFLVSLTALYAWFEVRAQKWKSKTVEPLNAINNKIDGLVKMVENNTEATAYIIRCRIEKDAQRYIARNSITFMERKEIEGMFAQYFALGFNHMEKSLRDSVMKLPIMDASCRE